MNRIITSVVFVAALLLSMGPAEPVQAESRFLNNLFSGGQRGRDRRAAASEQRTENREIQTALNFFEFDAGTVDGVMGGKSRTAISAYQSALNFPVTGQLSDAEQSFLLSSYNHIINGGDEMNWQVLSNQEGALGVLKSLYLEENPFADVTAAPVLQTQPSMRSFCVGIEAAGPVDLVKAQFCNLRQLTIDQTAYLLETAPNAQSLGQVTQQCEVFAGAMAPYTADILQTSTNELVINMANWAASSGMERDTLSRIAKTCLGAGYASDNTSIVLASALALVGMNDSVYIELMGYHIAFGLGFEDVEDFATAGAWMEHAVSGLLDGGETLTGQGSGQRAEIIVDVINIMATLE